MSIDHVLAVVPVADFEAAHAWYERLFGRPADNLPMEGRLVEWRVTGSGWVQVTRDIERAGSALLNFAVDDLDQHVAAVSARGLLQERSRRWARVCSYPPSEIPRATRSPSSGTSVSSLSARPAETVSSPAGSSVGPRRVRRRVASCRRPARAVARATGGWW